MVALTSPKCSDHSVGIARLRADAMEGKSLNHNVGQGVIISNQSLVLQGVSRASAGNYTCVGYNTEGDGESSPFYLNVMCEFRGPDKMFWFGNRNAPTCKPNQTRVHGVAKQEKVNISCAVEANPSDVTFRWLFNNSAEQLDVQSAHIYLHGTSSIVSYTPITDLDYGTLLCWATNRIGSQRQPCVFHIIAAGRPDLVYNCTVSNISMNSFFIRCHEGFNGGLPQSFILEVRETHSHELRANLTASYPRFSVTGLEPGNQYLAYVFAFNMKGRSEPVALQASTLRLPEKQLTAEKERPRAGFRFTPMMSVLIGIVSALFIVAVVIVVVLRLQCSHNEDRRKRHKAAAAEARGTGSGGSGDKGGSSPINKLDPGGTESGDSDEKNPDIIPQPSTVDSDEHTDFLRKRQHISTIETISPSRSLLQSGLQGPGYTGYCTLRNGMPLQDLNSIGSKPKMVSVNVPVLALKEEKGNHTEMTGRSLSHNKESQREIPYLPRKIIPTPSSPPPQRRISETTEAMGSNFWWEVPLETLSEIPTQPSPKPTVEGGYPTGTCTLPRQHWPSYGGGVAGVRHHPSSAPLVGAVPMTGMCASYPHHSHPHVHHGTLSEVGVLGHSQKQPLIIASPPLPLSEDDQATAETPLMITKRESTV
uniref:Nephrin/kirre n=1 Tax=Timema bartmani TaxID=61472 RepID=A0A7R9HYJ8_9NEOP|nr:unnamed protein product [Timema bartmani]